MERFVYYFSGLISDHNTINSHPLVYCISKQFVASVSWYTNKIVGYMETLADYFVDFMHLAYEVQFHLKIKIYWVFQTYTDTKQVCVRYSFNLSHQNGNFNMTNFDFEQSWKSLHQLLRARNSKIHQYMSKAWISKKKQVS